MTEVIACLGCFADRTMEAGRKDPKKYPMSYKLYKRAMQNATCCIHSKDTSMDRVLLYGLGNALRICGMTILQSSPDKKTVQLIHSEAKHMGIEHQYNPQELILHNHELQEKRIVDDKRRELGAAGEAKFTAWLRDEYTPAMLK